MANRYNQTNVGGVVTTSGGAMPASNFTNQHKVMSRVTPNKPASITTASGNAVEVGGDNGLYDTVSGASVSREKTNIDSIGI
jgi:hypothetical protein